MKDLINRMRLCAEDLHSINPASETVQCLSLGADALERLANEAKIRVGCAHALMLENARLRARLGEAEKMLNLTALLSQRPAPIPKQARFVRGYAMGGCKEQHGPALPEQTRMAANEKMTRTKLSRRDEKYLPHLKHWTATADIAALVGTSPASAVIVLKRMVLEGLVDMRRKEGVKGGAAVKYEWIAV